MTLFFISGTMLTPVLRDPFKERRSSFWGTTLKCHNFSLILLNKPLLRGHLSWKTIFKWQKESSLLLGHKSQCKRLKKKKILKKFWTASFWSQFEPYMKFNIHVHEELIGNMKNNLPKKKHKKLGNCFNLNSNDGPLIC